MPSFSDRFIFVICQGDVFHYSHQAKTPRTAIGRIDDNEIRLLDPFVSRYHAVIDHENDAWIVRDLASRNGTFINQQRIQESELRGGDVIQIGPYKLTICRPLANSEPLPLDPAEDTQRLQPRRRGNSQDNEPRLCLAPSQERVYQQLLEGHAVKAIARNLDLSRNTIHWHVTAIYQHFSVSSQAELLAQRLRDISSKPPCAADTDQTNYIDPNRSDRQPMGEAAG